MPAPRLAAVMTPFPHYADAAADLWSARAMMRQYEIRHLPVMRRGKLAGIISARDIDVAIAVAGDRASEVAIPVWAICKREPYVVEIDTPIARVAAAMADRQIGSALVTKHGKLAGIITTVDICRAFASLTQQRSPADDAA